MATDAVALAPRSARKQAVRRRRARLRLGLAVPLIALPLVVVALKLSPGPAGAWLRDVLTLVGPTDQVQHRVANVLLVPLGAALAVFFRVTLGIRLLGPFRSALLAIAFQVTGIPLGLFFLALVLFVIVGLRPLLDTIKLPNYGRLSVTLSTVAAIIMVALVAGQRLHLAALLRTAYFPIVVLSLTADGFAATLRREGTRSAIWRGAMTAATAVLITGIARIPGVPLTLARFPELLFVEIGLIIVISSVLGFRLLARWNPPIRKKRRRPKGSAASPVNSATSIQADGRTPALLITDQLPRRTAS